MSTSGEASALRAQREELRQELREIAGQWAKYSVALGMLRLARERYERERQPKVVQEAAYFFSKVTRARYTGLRAPVGAIYDHRSCRYRGGEAARTTESWDPRATVPVVAVWVRARF